MITGARKREPPCTTRCATPSTSSGASAMDAIVSTEPSRDTRPTFKLVEPALTTSTRSSVTARESDSPDLRAVPGQLHEVHLALGRVCGGEPATVPCAVLETVLAHIVRKPPR